MPNQFDATPITNLNSRDYFDKRIGGLKKDRESFISHWQDISKAIQPRRGRFLITDVNKGAKRHQEIINSRGTQALRVAKSGIFNGVMSPSRPWFKMETADLGLMRLSPVKEWLFTVERLMLTIFAESNLYNMAPTMLAELLLFGTGAMFQDDDFQDAVRFYTYPAGSYMIAQNQRYEVNTFAREFQMTVSQIAGQFGLENASEQVRHAFDLGNYEQMYPITHIVEPNPNFDPRSLLARHKVFRSVYFEPGNKETQNRFLSISGFDEFPVFVPRWEVTGEDVYGTNCPGMEALGDTKGSQIMERRKAQAVDKLVNPPLVGPPQIKNVPVSGLPGGLTVYSPDPNGHKLGPMYQINPNISELRADIHEIESRINEAFYVPLFLAISAMEGIQPKNQFELSQRNQERLQQLGPVLEQLHGEWLNRILERTFNRILRLWEEGVGIMPDPPQVLEGQQLRVRYVSSLSLAQRTFDITSIEGFSAFIGGISAFKPEALDKFNADEAVEHYATATGVPPSLVRDQQAVQAIREARAEEMARQQELEQAQMEASAGVQTASAVKQLSEVNQ